MAAAGTTSIDELPSSKQGNITLETSNKPVQEAPANINTTYNPQFSNNTTTISEQQPIEKNIQLSSSDITKIVEGIQQASANNMTSLPSRDIPQNQSSLTNDPEVQPNHVPINKGGFVEDFDNNNAALYKEQMQQKKNANQLETFYDTLQMPIMISIIFFIFQLPFINKMMFRYIPSLFLKEKQLSIGGYILKTALFGGVFIGIQYIINSLNVI